MREEDLEIAVKVYKKLHLMRRIALRGRKSPLGRSSILVSCARYNEINWRDLEDA